MKHWPALALLLAWAGAAADEAMLTMTPPPDFGAALPPLLQWARERNPEFATMRLESLAARERVVVAGALPDPMLQTELRDVTREGAGGGGLGDLTLDPSRVGSTRYQISQAIPAAGKRERQAAVAAAGADESALRAEALWNDLAVKIRGAWTQGWRFAQSLTVSREIRDLMRGVEETARRRYAAGLAAQQDVLRAQVEITALEGEIAQMASDLHGQQARLNYLLGRPPEAPLATPETLPALPAIDRPRHRALEDRLRENNPARRAEAARVVAAERAREVARDARLPDYRLGLGAVQMGNKIAEWELMLEVNIPLQRTPRQAMLREAEAMAQAARARASAVEAEAKAELAHAIGEYQAARQQEKLAAASLAPQAEVAFQSALAAYENGRGEFAGLLDAQRLLRQARLSRVKAHADAQLRIGEIEKAVGEPL